MESPDTAVVQEAERIIREADPGRYPFFRMVVKREPPGPTRPWHWTVLKIVAPMSAPEAGVDREVGRGFARTRRGAIRQARRYIARRKAADATPTYREVVR